MVKKVIKIFAIFVLILCIMISVIDMYAQATDDYSSKILTDLNSVKDGNETPNAPGKESVEHIVYTVIAIARIVGVTVAIVMLLVISIKYMTAAPGEKADIKKSAVVYVVGAIVLFAVTGILGIINSFSDAIKATT